MTKPFYHHTQPSDQYNRLVTACNLEQTPENSRTYLTTFADLLSIKRSMLSDCIRRNYVTAPVLGAAEAKGINPDSITTGIPKHLNKPNLK